MAALVGVNGSGSEGERGEIGDDFRVLRGGESCSERGHRWLGFFRGKSAVRERDLGERGGSG